MSDTAGSFAKELLEQAETAKKNQFNAKVDYMVSAFERECKLQAAGGNTSATLGFSKDTTTNEHVEEFRKRILGDPKNDGIEIPSDSVTNEGHFRVNVSWEHAEDIQKAKKCLYEFKRSLKIAIENGEPVHSWYVKKGSDKFERLVAEGIGEILNKNGIMWPAQIQTALSHRNHWIYVCDLPEQEQKQKNKAEIHGTMSFMSFDAPSESVPVQTHAKDVFNALLRDFAETADNKIRKGRPSFDFYLIELHGDDDRKKFVSLVSSFWYVDRVEPGSMPCCIVVFLKGSRHGDANPNADKEKEYTFSIQFKYSRSKLVIHELMRFEEKALHFLHGKQENSFEFALSERASRQDAIDFQDLSCHYLLEKHGIQLEQTKLWYDAQSNCITYLFKTP